MRTDLPAPPKEPGTAHELVVPAEQLVDALSCPICLELLRDPLIAACCQNNFCRQCLKSTLLSNPICPLCRAPLVLENTLPNRAIRNLLPHDSREFETGGEAQTFKPTNLSRRPAGCLLLILVISTACLFIGRSSSEILGAACLSAALPGRLWACRVSPDGAAQPTMRGGNSLEPDRAVPWGRVAADDAQEAPRLLRFSPPVAVIEAAQGGDDGDPSSSSSAGDGGFDGGDGGDAGDSE
eukprot:scaffold7277_cov62-Phaeocystis_antarctica.AAC.2